MKRFQPAGEVLGSDNSMGKPRARDSSGFSRSQGRRPVSAGTQGLCRKSEVHPWLIGGVPGRIKAPGSASVPLHLEPEILDLGRARIVGSEVLAVAEQAFDQR